MHKSAGSYIISALIIGAAFFWPMGPGQADEIKFVPKIETPAGKSLCNEANKPVSYVNRGEFAVKLVNYLGLNLDNFRFFKAPEVSDFYDDVPAGSPQANAVMILAYNGALPTTDRLFRPAEILSREEMAQVISSLLRQKAAEQIEPPAALPPIKDLAAAGSRAVDDIKLVVGLNIMSLNRDGSFLPKQGVTSEEVVAALKEVRQLVSAGDDDVTAKIISGAEGDRVLEISWGEKPSSGYEIYIVDIKLEGNVLTVNYQTKEPLPGSYNSTVITEPKDSKPIPVNYPAVLNIKLNKL
ncbi:S-layer homology domain-containing protein [Desulforamulus hydrothermalis]|uniref:S-layer domain protein n=1 Tax=Desulforamulus hydrothermalis Lam5 = DSM 18033 TaxID=1121428 RepID=K8EDV3_9FIRM|nr:S-layer homology domain-containing protein [Desulforamulus hydrothermalis]CCO06981.1 S-layer domain protein [Desulforamulus hydrothermalis Lam5 = DSM 18033]SHG98347.1 S-layer homology domain-containing protein [Desulforamulus hydrothermalis Lam5 = DSM 18033]